MASCVLPDLPTNLESVKKYLDFATNYETTDPSVSYWCRVHTLHQGFLLKKTKEDLAYLLILMKWIGEINEELKSLETVSDLSVAQIHLEKVASKAFNLANYSLSAEQCKKIVFPLISSAWILLDVCSIFGDLNEEMAKKKRYSQSHATNMQQSLTLDKLSSQFAFNKKMIDSSLVEPEVKENSQPLVVVPQSVAKKYKPLKKVVTLTEMMSEMIAREGTQGSSLSPSVVEAVSTFPPAVADINGAVNRAPGKSSPLKYTYKDDQWSPVNPEGKKTYDRQFLLELQSNPACQKKLDRMAKLEIVCDEGSTIKRGVSVGDFTPPFVKMMPAAKGLPNTQQGSHDEGMDQQQPATPISDVNSLIRRDRPEDLNVLKPKHASKSSKKEKENHEKASTEEMLKTVREILNKLTPASKFDKLLERIQALNMKTEERLSGVFKLIFEKAIDGPIFSSTCAKMCQALSTKVVASSANRRTETISFRKLLLARCQEEFNKDRARIIDVEKKKKEIESTETEAKMKELEEELKELVNFNRRRSLNNIRFIGELCKLEVISQAIRHQCILRLLSQPEDEGSLECLCLLLSTIGKELESPTQPSDRQKRSASISSAHQESMVNSYFSSLDTIVQKRKVSNRIRFLIQDIIDLRQNQWEPTRQSNIAEKIQGDIDTECEDQE